MAVASTDDRLVVASDEGQLIATDATPPPTVPTPCLFRPSEATGRSVRVPFTIRNNSTTTFDEVVLEHRANDKEWDAKDRIEITNFKPGAEIGPFDMHFGLEKPSVWSQVLLSGASLGLLSGLRGWGKDYWEIEVKANGRKWKSNHFHAVKVDIWFANVWQEDAEGAQLLLLPLSDKFQAALVRHSGMSTRQLDPA
eukprot:NODE_2607_length_668_cov_69.079160_g2142_i0.p1 GENE.NODE_2607_length_668_cov_69.079160_g2142_i0~~NODE_2607_length_668_cov_69.079160_g2142_i0.p1  ORF type:complete len:206 (+),score=41.79 NODE_2607_length_668_cov_69.079160_g2142_i0:33-620(+)